MAPSVYISSLADHEAGHPHGFWINLEGKSFAEVSAELLDGLIAGDEVFNPSRKDGEWKIFDYKGFMGIILRGEEVEDLAKTFAIAEAVQQCGEGFAIFWENQYGRFSSVENAVNAFWMAYEGNYSSLAEYAKEDFQRRYAIPNRLCTYVDWERMGQDSYKSGEIWIGRGKCGIHVFTASPIHKSN